MYFALVVLFSFAVPKFSVWLCFGQQFFLVEKWDKFGSGGNCSVAIL